MLTTLDEILKREGVKPEDTVYEREPAAVRQFLLSAGDFFRVCSAGADREGGRKSGEAVDLCQKTAEGRQETAPAIARMKEDETKRESIRRRMEEISRQLKGMKTDEEDRTHAHAEEIRSLREEKKRLARELTGDGQNSGQGGSAGDGGNNGHGGPRKWIRFKNSLDAMSLSMIQKILPSLRTVCFRDAWEMPFFVRNLEVLQKAFDNGEELAVTGGPCLFGVNEVLVRIAWQSGSVTEYDFSSGRHYVEEGRQRNLGDDLMRLGGEVEDIFFLNRKKGITSQEYDSIHCLFECARALHARLTIPLPDMSYIKYWEGITRGLPEKTAKRAGERFRHEAYRISDGYRELIRQMQSRYPEVETKVIHERDQRLCRLFYENRKPFLKEAEIRRLTDVPGKTESVLDYITMPALPFYIWGIRHILQMDSLDETDSYRKCVKLHKNELNLCAMLYPERISGDGRNTIFYAPLPFKEYRQDEGGERECENG